jgi:hypothetical protein
MQVRACARVAAVLSAIFAFSCMSSPQQPSSQPQNDFVGWFSMPPGPDQNRESHAEWAGMRSYLGAGYARYDLSKSYLRWPLSPGTEKYASIDGDHIKTYVNEITAINQQSHDDGNQYWGRIVGTKYDLETDEWLMKKFTDAGLQDVRRQELDVPPQWWANSWTVTLGMGSAVRKLESAFPFTNAPSTPPQGLDLETVDVGLGRAADFAGRDVAGKAVVIYSIPSPGVRDQSAQWFGSVERAEENHAAAVLVVLGLPGNFSAQTMMPPSSTAPVPTFLLGQDDGMALMDAIGKALPGPGPRVHLQLDVTPKLGGQKTGMVWGELPGSTDESIYLMAPMDSFFTGAMDNASGIAVMAALAEYYAKIPQSQRRRTIYFVGTPGHHDGDPGTAWLHDHKADVFGKTAIIINCAHITQTQVNLHGPFLRYANTFDTHRMVLHGSPKFDAIAVKASFDFGIATDVIPDANGGGALSRIAHDAPSMFFLDMSPFYHTTGDIPEYVPAAGLEQVARAYAEIIDEVIYESRRARKRAAATWNETLGNRQPFVASAVIGIRLQICVRRSTSVASPLSA